MTVKEFIAERMKEIEEFIEGSIKKAAFIIFISLFIFGVYSMVEKLLKWLGILH